MTTAKGCLVCLDRMQKAWPNGLGMRMCQHFFSYVLLKILLWWKGFLHCSSTEIPAVPTKSICFLLSTSGISGSPLVKPSIHCVCGFLSPALITCLLTDPPATTLQISVQTSLICTPSPIQPHSSCSWFNNTSNCFQLLSLLPDPEPN